MTQEKRRSISYRSFLTCDNPKGVECGAIRKCRTSSSDKREDHITSKVESEKKQMGITGFTRELVDTSPSFQLPEVVNNKGAITTTNSLNHVTNSYQPYNNTHKDEQEDIAKDLLIGVLDLQESLAILRKLQENSDYNSKKKQKEMRFDDMVDSSRFGYLHDEKKNKKMKKKKKKELDVEFQGPRVSLDGPLRKPVDEVKSVVRESLLRKNVVKHHPTISFDDHFHHPRRLDSPTLPCSSSSSFSLFNSSVSSVNSQRRKKGKSANLIVKLMGLESPPPSPRSCSRQEEKKVLNLAKPMCYDIESPRATRKPNDNNKFGGQDLGTKQSQSAFDEILESLNFKGLLRSNSALKGMGPNSSRGFEDWPLVDERPPIVVMRPLKTQVRNHESASFRDKLRELTAKERTREDEKVTYIRRKGEEKNDAHHFDELGSWRQKYGDFLSKNQKNYYEEKMFSNTLLDYRNKKASESYNQPKKKRQPVLTVEIQRRSKGVRKEEGIECVYPTFDSMLISNFNIQRWKEHYSRPMISDYDAESQSSVSETTEGTEYINSKNSLCGETCQIDDNHSLHSELTSTSISEYCSVGGHLEDSTHGDKDDETSPKPLSSPRAKMKAFFLNSPPFINRAEELFNLQVHPSSAPHVTDENEWLDDVVNSKVLLDCATELMELKSCHISQGSLPPFMTAGPRKVTSVGPLLEEICEGIEDLGGYIDPDSKGFTSDSLYSLLERDLGLKSGSTWGIGWRSTFSLDEVELIVGEVERIVLGNLIQEVVADFLL